MALIGSLLLSSRASATLPTGTGPFGAPRPWEGGMGVGPYSVVNLRTGHVLTTLHIVGWGGAGGGIQFNLYHNSPDDNSGIVVTPEMEKEHNPFDPVTEAIWRTSFSSFIKVADVDTYDLTRDDGTVDRFILVEDVWVPPPGVFDTLEVLSTPVDGATFILTSKQQSVARYDAGGALIDITDASGNVIECEYDIYGVMTAVIDAAGRRIEFLTDSHDRLTDVIDPQFHDNTGRQWELVRSSTTGTFTKLIDPLSHEIEIGYDLHGRITSLEDKNGKTTYLHYTDAKLTEVDDPSPLTTDVNFAYTADTGGASHTVYTDRKSKNWTYHFDADDNIVSMTNPLSKTWTAAYDAEAPQLAHHATSITNPLSKTWSMEWDEFGNLILSTNPLTQTTSRTYDSLNNLTSVTPPLNNSGDGNEEKTVTIEYEDELNPTRPTKIIEPPALENEDPAETTIFYYHKDSTEAPSDPEWNGQVAVVVDPNGVQTVFEYDDYGQPASEIENPQAVQDINVADVVLYTTIDSSGYTTGTKEYTNGGGGEICSTITTNAGGNVTGSECQCILFNPPPLDVWPLASWASNIGHDNNGNPTTMSRYVSDEMHSDGSGTELSTRTYGMLYDAVGRPTYSEITTNEPGFNQEVTPAPTVTRTQSFEYNDATGTTTYDGPDGEAIIVTTDDCSRTYQVTRTTPGGRIIQTTTTYDDAGREWVTTNGNETTTTRTYDDADRLYQVIHRRGTSGAIFLRQTYHWTPDGLLDMVTEYDDASPTSGTADAIVYYGYDNRNRLISEQRVDYGGTGVAPVEYHFTYTYDLGGNRLTKTDVTNGIATNYKYDVGTDNDGSVDYNQHNNRLLYYKTQTVGGSPTTIEEGWYHYGAAGHVNRFIKWKASDGTTGGTGGTDYKRVHAYAFHYNKAGQLWISVSMRGELGIGSDPDDDPDNNYVELAEQYDLPLGSVLQNVIGVAAMEYRYDGSGRQRYLVRPRTADEFLQPTDGAASGTWHDFVGDEIYNDYDLTFIPEVEDPPAPAGIEVADRRAYLSGSAYDDTLALGSPHNWPVYEHGDQIGTNRRLTATDNVGSPAVAPLLARSVYSAFGEPLDQTAVGGVNAVASFKRGYAGSWGYQAGDAGTVTVDVGEGSYWGDENDDLIAPADPMTELGWLHVGERYYDPSCGRFVMRDPIGIGGGLNTYAYCLQDPNYWIDPSGMGFVDWWCGGDAVSGPGSFWLNVTGGERSWMDNKSTVDRVGAITVGVPLGVAIMCVPGAAPIAYWAATGWGFGRMYGGISTGVDDVDNVLDGTAGGIGLVGLPGLPGPAGPIVRRGALKGLRGSVNGPKMIP